jgi:hypothetical protein
VETKLDVHCDKIDKLDDGDVVLAQVDLSECRDDERVIAMRYLTARLKEQFPRNRAVVVDEHVKLDVVRRKIESGERFDGKEV